MNVHPTTLSRIINESRLLWQGSDEAPAVRQIAYDLAEAIAIEDQDFDKGAFVRGCGFDIPPALEDYREDLTDQTILHGDPGDNYSHHTWPCSCGCKPVTQAQATERELRSRGLWPS